MRILHTSDLHLSENRPETVRALEELLKTGEGHDVDILTIGGDLFHSEEDAEVLRPRLRDIFSGDIPEIFTIPGNHDAEAYQKNLNWGSKIKVATEEPFSTFEFDGFTLVALPFKEDLTSGLYDRLRRVSERYSKTVLLLHCTLDMGYSSEDFGEEESTSYFPITQDTLSEWSFDFVLAGHFHRNQFVTELDNGGKFIYPGSPVSHSWGELGRRKAVLVDVKAEKEEELTLNTFYRDEFERNVRPGEERAAIDEISTWVEEREDDKCELKVLPKGHIKMDETEFGEMLEEACESAELSHERYKNVEKVLNHTLFRRFKDRLDSRKDIDNKKAVEEMVLDAMSRLIANRELRS